MLKALIRCNEGHYFEGEYCPFDGWSSQESKQLTELSKRIQVDGNQLSADSLARYGADEVTLARTIVVEFGVANFVFDAISPDGYRVDGKFHRLRDLPREWL